MQGTRKWRVKRKALWTTIPGFGGRTGSADPRGLKRRKRVRAVSEILAERRREYSKLARRFLRDHPKCACGCGAKSRDVHHTRGRSGRLLLDWRLWLALARSCHDWVRDNPDAARDAGLLCEKGKWLVPLETPVPVYQSPT